MLAYDQFSQSFTIGLDEGKSAIPSPMGSLCTLLLLVFLIVAAVYKVTILEGKKAIDILSVVEENHFDEDFIFGREQGLYIAAGVFNLFDPNTFYPIDPSYGRIKFSKREWGADPQGN